MRTSSNATSSYLDRPISFRYSLTKLILIGLFLINTMGCNETSSRIYGSKGKGLAQVGEPLWIGPLERPAPLYVGIGTDPAPLYVMLHGYGSSGEGTANYLKLKETLAKIGGHLLLPDGRVNSEGRRFWDATPACCEFELAPSNVDETYLKTLVVQAKNLLSTRLNGVTFIGYSNGSFMAQRFACRQSSLVDQVISFVGAGYENPEECRRADPSMAPAEPQLPVTMMHIHGEWDPVVLYNGGEFLAPYPSARTTVDTWSKINECASSPVEQTRFLELSFEGVELGREPPPEGVVNLPMETDVTEYQECLAPTLLLTMRGLAHVPRYRSDLIEYLVTYLNQKQGAAHLGRP